MVQDLNHIARELLHDKQPAQTQKHPFPYNKAQYSNKVMKLVSLYTGRNRYRDVAMVQNPDTVGV